MDELDIIDVTVLERLQRGLPLVPQPWTALQEETGVPAALWCERLQRHLASGLLTRFGPMFDIERLGGAFTLAAMAVPTSDFERVADLLQGMPEVAHNYERVHRLNMWFVLACETPAGIDRTITRVEQATGLAVLNLPKEQTFHVGLYLPVRPQGDAPVSLRAPARKMARQALSAERLCQARELVALTQGGLPLVTDPWAWIAEHMGLTPRKTLALLRALQAAGAIRRIAAVPNHYRLGWRHNGMTVWDVDDASLGMLGPQVGALPFVSHCYRRPRRDGWRYNLFAMVHGRQASEIEAQRAQIRGLLGAARRGDDMLVSRRILKKTGLRLGNPSRSQPQTTEQGAPPC